MSSGETPRRHLLRQEEQDETIENGTQTPRCNKLEAMELQCSSSDTSSVIFQPRSRKTTGQVGSQSSSSTTTATTTSSSNTSANAKRSQSARRLLFSGRGRALMGVGTESSTNSSSTDETEARELRFGSIELQPLTTGRTSGPPGGPGGGVIKSAEHPNTQAILSLTADAQLSQALLADFGIFCPVHSQRSAVCYNPSVRGKKKSFQNFARMTYLPRLQATKTRTENQRRCQTLFEFLFRSSHASANPAVPTDVAMTTTTTTTATMPQFIGPYRIEKLLGRGNSAVVKLAWHTQVHVNVAVKIINKELVGNQNLSKISREFEAMKLCHHPHIIRLYHLMETDANIFMVMEYASRGEVFDHISLSHAFTEKEARELFWQIVCAVDYCHKSGIVHRDLKAENLLIDADFKIKVADFGFCNFFRPENLLTTHCGSPQYAAPELFKGEPYDGPLVDVWSLGVILYILVCGSFPFTGESLGDIRNQVLRGLIRFPFFLSTACEHVIRGMLQVDPARRFKLVQVTATAWMQASPDLLHYTRLMAHFEVEVHKRQLDELFQRQFPEHSTMVLATRKERQIQQLDGGVIRALNLTTGIDEHEIRMSTSQQKYDRLHAAYELLRDKIRRFIDHPLLKEAVDSAIRDASSDQSGGLESTIPLPSVSPLVSHLEPSSIHFSTSTVATSSAADTRSAHPPPAALTGSADDLMKGEGRGGSKLFIWREESEKDLEDEEEEGEVSKREGEIPANFLQLDAHDNNVTTIYPGQEKEDMDVNMTASAVGNLVLIQSSKSADDATGGLELLSDWVKDFKEKKSDVRIVLSILQANENEILQVLTDQIPETTKNLRRHTIQLPSPTLFHRLSESRSGVGGLMNSKIEPGLFFKDNASPASICVNEVSTVTDEEQHHAGSVAASEGVRTMMPRIPRQITQPELGNWRRLQRESITGQQRSVLASDTGLDWLQPRLWTNTLAGRTGFQTNIRMAPLNIADVKELSLDLGQEAANTLYIQQYPPNVDSCFQSKCYPTAVNLRTHAANPDPPVALSEKQMSAYVPQDGTQQSSSMGQSWEGWHLDNEEGVRGMERGMTCYEDLLPQLNLPACLPSMIHQPVALFTTKNPNLLAPPEFMNPHSSSFPRRSSDGAADMPALHRPFPLIGGSYPEKANYRSEHKQGSSVVSKEEVKIDTSSNLSKDTRVEPLATEASDPITYLRAYMSPFECGAISTESQPGKVSDEEDDDHKQKMIPPPVQPSNSDESKSFPPDTPPLITCQKRFSLPIRQPPPFINLPSDKWKGSDARKFQQQLCCCENLLAGFFEQNKASEITVESVVAYKSFLLLQQQSEDEKQSTPSSSFLGGDWLMKRSDSSGFNPTTIRRGSEATQLQALNQRMAQFYGSAYVPLGKTKFARWLSYETKDQLEALSQVKRQELRTISLGSAEEHQVGAATIPSSLESEVELVAESLVSANINQLHNNQSPTRSPIYRVESKRSLAFVPSEMFTELSDVPLDMDVCQTEILKTEITRKGSKRGREGTGDSLKGFRPHSSWNEKLSSGGQRKRHPLQRSKSQVSWTDVKRGCYSGLLKLASEHPHTTQAQSVEGLPVPEVILVDDDETEQSSTKRSPLIIGEGRGRRRTHTDTLRAVPIPDSEDRKMHINFLTSPKRKIYNEWLPKMTAFSKKAAEAFTRPSLRISSLVQDLSPRVLQKQHERVSTHFDNPLTEFCGEKSSESNADASQLSIIQQQTLPNVALMPLMSDSSGFEIPTDEKVEDIGDSPHFQMPLHKQQLPSFYFPQHQQLMMASNFSYYGGSGSKLQLRASDEDDDLAVIDQVNRRLALGQLESPFPWEPHCAFHPFNPCTIDQKYPASDIVLNERAHLQVNQQQQQQQQQQFSQLLPAPLSQQNQYFFPSGAFAMDNSGVVSQHSTALRTAYRTEGANQLPPPEEEPISEVEMTNS